MANRELKVIAGSTVLALALAVAAFFAPTSPVENASNPTPAPTEPADPTALTDLNQVFDPSQITEIKLDIPDKSKKVLENKNRDDYVPATFQIIVGDKSSPVMNVGIKIKGTTSRQAITSTWAYTSFKVKFNFGKENKTQTLLGKKSLTLNAMTQDSSKIHETFAYEAYRANGVPASRTGYAHLTLSKNIPKPDRGLYLVLESLDDEFLADNFTDVTQHLYENNHNFNEIYPSAVGEDVKEDSKFNVKEGWKASPNRNDLRVFAKGIQASGQKLWDFLGANTDRDSLIMQFAVDNFTGGWDTYSGPLINNYHLRFSNEGKMTMLPWGLDNTWGENWFNDGKSTNWVKSYEAPSKAHDDYFFPLDTRTASFPGSFLIAYGAGVTDSEKMTNYQLGRGQLFWKCLNFSPCKTQYFQNLQKVSQWATDTKLADRMLATGNLIKKYATGYNRAEVKRTSEWVGKQQARIEKAIAKNCKLGLADVVELCR
jgi:spore coat protein CotH